MRTALETPGFTLTPNRSRRILRKLPARNMARQIRFEDVYEYPYRPARSRGYLLDNATVAWRKLVSQFNRGIQEPQPVGMKQYVTQGK